MNIQLYIACVVDINGKCDTYLFSTHGDPWEYWYEYMHEKYIEGVSIYKADQIFKH